MTPVLLFTFITFITNLPLFSLNTGICKPDKNHILVPFTQRFFSVVYLSLDSNSPVKIYSLIQANKKVCYIDILNIQQKELSYNEIFLLHVLYINCIKPRNFLDEFITVTRT